MCFICSSKPLKLLKSFYSKKDITQSTELLDFSKFLKRLLVFMTKFSALVIVKYFIKGVITTNNNQITANAESHNEGSSLFQSTQKT